MNRSFPELSGVMNPKPLPSLNHFTVHVAISRRTLDPRDQSSAQAAERPAPARLVLADVLLATPPNQLLLARCAKLARFLLRPLVPLRDLLLARDQRRIRRRSSRSGVIRLCRHWTHTSSSLPEMTGPQDECESETSSGGDGLSTGSVHVQPIYDARRRGGRR
jgi:hypothetical protein